MIETTIPETTEITDVAKMVGRKRPRRVSFSAKDAGCVPSDCATEEEIKGRWYQKNELTLFKIELREYILRNAMATTTSEGPQHQHQQRTQETETRGYERHTLERCKNKKIAIRCTLLAYKKGMREDEVAKISQKCSSWAQTEAFKLGCRDFCEVYHPDLLIAQQAESKKRALEETSSGECRCVRARACYELV